MNAINVVMIGASRSGKTSILASMLNNMKHQDISKYFIFNDNNALEYNMLSNADKLDVRLRDLICDMQDLVNPNVAGLNVPRMGALKGTDHIFTYRFKVESKSSNNTELNVHFTDVPGEYCVNTHLGYDQYVKEVRKSQILVVAVDVPSMMYAKLHHKAKLNVGMNLPDEVNEAAQRLGQDFNDSNLFRMVIFVPIKCEYWIHHNLMNDVYAEIKNVYDDAIATIKNYANMRSFILPVETIGGCEFDHHSEYEDSFLLLSNRSEIGGLKEEDIIEKKSAFRCEKIGTNRCRLKNGEIYELDSKDDLILTTKIPFHPYFLEEVGVQIPYTWYIRKDNIGYKPKDCEQLLLHVLKFAIEAQGWYNMQDVSWWDRLRNVFSFGGYFDKLQLKAFSNGIRELTQNKRLKEIPSVGVLVNSIN